MDNSSQAYAEDCFHRANDAERRLKYDEAIKLYDECLVNNPNSWFVPVSYFFLAQTILKKFRFHEREDVSDAEMKWCLRMEECAKRAKDKAIYELNNNASLTHEGVDRLREILDAAEQLEKRFRFYGPTFYNKQKRQLEWRDFHKVHASNIEPLMSLEAFEKEQLEKDKAESASKKTYGCFIATAAYGSASEPEVEYFKCFRDDVLLTTQAGRGLTKVYYRVSPRLAKVVEQSIFFKRTVRYLLLGPILKILSIFYKKYPGHQ